jgi:hypothetical protein
MNYLVVLGLLAQLTVAQQAAKDSNSTSEHDDKKQGVFVDS